MNYVKDEEPQTKDFSFICELLHENLIAHFRKFTFVFSSTLTKIALIIYSPLQKPSSYARGWVGCWCCLPEFSTATRSIQQEPTT